MKLLPGYVARNDFIRTRLEIQSSTKPELDYHNGSGSGALPHLELLKHNYQQMLEIFISAKHGEQ